MRSIIAGLVVLLLTPLLLLAKDPETSTTTDALGEVLVAFLVLSLIFESALTPIFNWRVFAARFEGQGVKTPLTVILALLVFWGYKLDILRDVLVALRRPPEPPEITFWGQVITAFLIAGGSDGVFRIFTKLKIRDPAARKAKAEQARAALEAKKKLEDSQ